MAEPPKPGPSQRIKFDLPGSSLNFYVFMSNIDINQDGFYLDITKAPSIELRFAAAPRTAYIAECSSFAQHAPYSLGYTLEWTSSLKTEKTPGPQVTDLMGKTLIGSPPLSRYKTRRETSLFARAVSPRPGGSLNANSPPTKQGPSGGTRRRAGAPMTIAELPLTARDGFLALSILLIWITREFEPTVRYPYNGFRVL
jgi:hypothetical protein